MLNINGLDQGLEIFKVLGSEMRMRIVSLLADHPNISLNEMASLLGVTNGALTPHIRKLEEVGVIRITTEHTAGGIRKLCSLAEDHLLFNLIPSEDTRAKQVYETRIRIGHYNDYSVSAGCGLAGETAIIGPTDDPRVFAYPERVDAKMLWFHDGYVEYRIPNLVPAGNRIVQLTISFEVSSADFGSPDDTLSDIRFYLNDTFLGSWLSFPLMVWSKGIYTPGWWIDQERQHGFLKMMVISQAGVFLDGKKINDADSILPEEGAEQLKFRIEARPLEGHKGGVALFGNGFGNYEQDILVRVHYMPEEVFR